MSYKSIEENPAFRIGKEYGKFIAKQIIPHTAKRREYIPKATEPLERDIQNKKNLEAAKK